MIEMIFLEKEFRYFCHALARSLTHWGAINDAAAAR
jgi:hypothetical protein